MSEKLPKIFLNLDFFTKGRNLKWIKKNGGEAVAILQNVWIASSQEKNCRIKKEDAYALTFNLLFEEKKVIDVLESAVEVGLLESDGEFYFNSQIVNDDKSFKEKRKNYVKGHLKRKQIQDESKVNSDTIQDKSIVDFIDTDIDTEDDIESEDLKKETVSNQAYVFPGEFKLLRFSTIDYENLLLARGQRTLDRTIQLAESHIQKQKHADPDLYQKLKKQALEGAAFINGWAVRQAHVDISEIKRATARVKKITEPYQNQKLTYQETARPIPKEYKPPPDLPEITPEQREKNKKMVADLVNTLSEKKRVA